MAGAKTEWGDMYIYLVVQYFSADAWERVRGRTRLRAREAGQRRDQNGAGLRLPPGVDNRAPAVADVQVIPDPRLRIDRFSYRPHQPDRGEIVFCRPLGSPLHEGANRRGRRVEDGDAVAFDNLPHAIFLRPVRALEQSDVGRLSSKHGSPQLFDWPTRLSRLRVSSRIRNIVR